MKKIAILIFISVLTVLNININLSAARSENKTLDLYISDFTEKIDEYYLDILIKGESCDIDNLGSKEKIVSENSVDGYIGGTTCTNDIKKTYFRKEKNRDHHQFEGEIPQEFKIIIVKSDESVIISEEVKIEAYNSIVYFQVNSSKVSVQNVYFNIFSLILFNFIVVLFLKLIILYLFKIGLFNNLKLILPVNIVTVGLISIIVSYTNYFDGYLFAFKSLLLLQSIFFLLEAIYFSFKLKEINLAKRFLYSFISNLIGFIISTLFILITLI